MNILVLTIVLGIVLFTMVIKHEVEMKRIKVIQDRQQRCIDRLEQKKLDYALLRQRIDKIDREMNMSNMINKAKDVSVEFKEICNPIGFNIASNKTVGDMIEQVENTYKQYGIDISYEEIILRE